MTSFQPKGGPLSPDELISLIFNLLLGIRRVSFTGLNFKLRSRSVIQIQSICAVGEELHRLLNVSKKNVKGLNVTFATSFVGYENEEWVSQFGEKM
ncbi:hypothetical protein M8C21_014549 [Ambrosia artemisiifolia]|uniref:Uncharacterized protein n=1 Tax=Ambrosia artemisiifolia TaxID=4212 RepID=A0AAD5CBI1_AMBAR|nr:hypothetical protein M8C21_014549 [Ambrosia artemisiifolia]